jgi:hypothetical protein
MLFLSSAGALALTGSALAQQPQLPPETPEAIRRDMATIGKYRAEVERRLGKNRANEQKAAEDADAARAASGEAAPAGTDDGNRGGLFTPLTIAPPRTSITPDAPERAIDNVIRDRDPFEVSPRLREDNARNNRAGMQEGMALNQSLRLRAVVRGPEGGIAKIQSGGTTLIVRDGDEIDVNGIRYTVYVEADGLMLRGAGAPQYKMLVR